MSDEAKAYREQAKAPRKGVKADDADEYQAKDSFYKETDQKGKAYANQEKAPKGKGSRGPSQADGPEIMGWDKSPANYRAYEAQDKWGSKSDNMSLGFKLEGKEAGYLGHFAEDYCLRQGHNDVDTEVQLKNTSKSIRDYDGAPADKPSPPSPNKKSGDEDKGSFMDFMLNDSKAMHQDD